MNAPASGSWFQAFALGVLALVPPITTAVYGVVMRDKELAITKQDKDFAMTVALLDRAVDPKLPAEDRKLVLRFLAAVGNDGTKLAGWASAEVERVDKQLASLQGELAANKHDEVDAFAEVERIKTEGGEDQAAPRAGGQLHAAIAKLEQKQRARMDTEARISSAIGAANAPSPRASESLTQLVSKALPSRKD